MVRLCFGKDEEWLRTRLTNMGYRVLGDLLLVTCDNKEQFSVYLKENGSKSVEILE